VALVDIVPIALADYSIGQTTPQEVILSAAGTDFAVNNLT